MSLALDELIRIDEICRTHNPPIKFIAADALGVFSYIFNDFGDQFDCQDRNGEPPETLIVTSVGDDGWVTVHESERIPFDEGEPIEFLELQSVPMDAGLKDMATLNNVDAQGISA